jgi:hypothetical protein
MSSRDYLKHTVSNNPPASSNAGDEYFAPGTNTLYKRVVYSGTNVAWSQIVSTADGNINLTGNNISLLANNKYPIYFSSTTTRNTSNSYVGINASGFPSGGGGYYQSTSALPSISGSVPEANVSIYFQPRGWGGILTSIPDPNYPANAGDGHPGNFRGFYSVDLQLARNGGTSVASGQYSALLGGYNSAVSGFASAGLAGSRNSITGSYAAAVAGRNSTVDGDNSVVLGGNYATTRGITFYNVITSSGIAYGTASSGSSFAHGAVMTLAATTNASNPSRVLLTSGNNGDIIITTTGTRNVLILPNNSLFGFKGTVVGAVSGSIGSGYAAWTFEGSIARGATAASTTLLGVPTISMMGADSVALTNNWYIAIDVDTVNGWLRVTVRGDTTNSIRWYCRLDTSEVAYS